MAPPSSATLTLRLEPMKLSLCLAMAHKKNPKEHRLQDLITSFLRFGFVAFPTIDEMTEVMVAGHGRCLALDQMRKSRMPPPAGVSIDGDEWLLPVIRGISFKNEGERDAYLLADNEHVIASGWDPDARAALIRDLVAHDTLLDGLAIDADELAELLEGTNTDLDGDSEDPPKTNVRQHTRTLGGSALTYKLIITCKDEDHQATLLEQLEADGLTVSPLIT